MAQRMNTYKSMDFRLKGIRRKRRQIFAYEQGQIFTFYTSWGDCKRIPSHQIVQLRAVAQGYVRMAGEHGLRVVRITSRFKVIILNRLPDNLRKTISEQTFHWLEKVGKASSDTFNTFTLQKDASDSLDSIKMGTSNFSTGAQIALPFYAKFKSQDEAFAYAKEQLEPFKVLGKNACIVWESQVGQQLLSTFVLSEEALAFLVARDLFGVKEGYLLTQEGLSWFCHTLSYMCCFYVLHRLVFNGSALSFIVIYPVLLAVAVFTAKQWNDLAVYANERRADLEAAKMSQRHTNGGREFYTKFMLRNRLLRDLIEGGDKLFTEVGDYRKAIAEYVVRYDDIGTVRSENEQLSPCIDGDDIPGEM